MTLGGTDRFNDQQVPDDVLEDILAILDSTDPMFSESSWYTPAFSMYGSVLMKSLPGQQQQLQQSSVTPPALEQSSMDVGIFKPNIVIKQERFDDASCDGFFDKRRLIPETVSQFYDTTPPPVTCTTDARLALKSELFEGYVANTSTLCHNNNNINGLKCERTFSLTELDCLLNNTDIYTQDNSFYDSDHNPSALRNPTKLTAVDQPFGDMNLVVKSEPSSVPYDSLEATNRYTGGATLHLPTSPLTVDQQTAMETFQAIPMDLLKQVKDEIDQTCSVTAIPQTPESWTIDHVQRWVTYTLHHFQLPLNRVENFNVTGSTLASFTEDEFKKRSPEAGSTLYAQLEIWMNALALCHDIESVTVPIPKPNLMYMNLDTPSVSNNGQPHRQQQHQQQNCGTMVVGIPASPTSSHDSEMDSPRRDSLSSLSTESDQGCYHAEEEGIKQNIHLWQFLKDLLLQPQFYGNCIRWLDRKNGIFKIEDSARVARLWGKRKNRPAMNYDKLSRSIRQYYKKGIIKKTEHSKRLIYRFCHPYLL